ncbi:tyrosine-type recombinase/integrase [Coprobacter tertius]|uniref:Site-specific integrase n=1 Tax=Coprobacter tertius TaxID=2944915 RepID=A0ABT1MGL9_9BACT|nr:site-specific integrase [Coprobacter tertius]MCP9611775.1 site-specific integrase [Coprobacter tertius]
MKNESNLNYPLPDILNKIIDSKKESGKLRTAANYLATVSKVNKYIGTDTRKFYLRDISPEWVSGFVDWLHRQHPGKPQTADFYVRNTRALYNQAVKLLVHDQHLRVNPFEGIAIKGIRRSGRALSQREVRGLLSTKLRCRLSRSQKETLDLLLFMLYMRGMVFQDIFNLRRNAVDAHGHIQYLRSKTGIPINFIVPPEALKIMNDYSRINSPYVFPFLHMHHKIKEKEIGEESALRRVNRHALAIGEKAGLSTPLTTYVIRHTWATLMLEAGKPVELISQCLGHTSIRTTQIYLSKISIHKVDREVEDMVNLMLRNGTKRPGSPIGKKKIDNNIKNNEKSRSVKQEYDKSKSHTHKLKIVLLLKKIVSFFVRKRQAQPLSFGALYLLRKNRV